MTNSVQRSLYTLVGMVSALSFSVHQTLAAGAGGGGMNIRSNDPDKISSLEGNQQSNMEDVANSVVNYVVGLLYFIAVVFTLWGGFQILTAGGDDDKVKKGKSTIIRGVIGLVVIFLASTLIRWIVSLFTGAATGN